MRRSILADTGPLYAALDRDDQFHERAQSELKRIQDERFTVLISYPNLLESYTLVLYRLGSATANGWLKEINSGASLINPTSEDYLEAQLTVSAFPDQRITLFDSVLAALAVRLGCPVWSYDYHFDVMQTPVWR